MTEDKEGWKDLARCSGLPMTRFFPEDRNKQGSKAHLAEVQTLREEFCWQCPVRVGCFEYALENDHSRAHGVWAGTTPADRLSFIQVRCRCGRSIDPFDLVTARSWRCKVCQVRDRLEEVDGSTP
jgi:hypothetical protein